MSDCNEGCADNCRHKWQIEPHPYSNDFDVFVTDDDSRALEALKEAAEQAWDQCGDGMTRTITIRRAPHERAVCAKQMKEAADEIERLQRELADARADLEHREKYWAQFDHYPKGAIDDAMGYDRTAQETSPVQPNPNTGHGHVRPRPDGVKARCGGPGICAECSREAAQNR